VKPSVFLSPTDFMASTDGINPSVKLDNVVVYKESLIFLQFFYSLLLLLL
jgi:hypothetical protein